MIEVSTYEIITILFDSPVSVLYDVTIKKNLIGGQYEKNRHRIQTTRW